VVPTGVTKEDLGVIAVGFADRITPNPDCESPESNLITWKSEKRPGPLSYRSDRILDRWI